MSKKAAEGLAALTLDVKIGKAALIADEKAARQLGHLLVTYRHHRLHLHFILMLVSIERVLTN